MDGTIRAKGVSVATPATGAGLEMRYLSSTNTASILGFNRGTSTYIPLAITGSTFALQVSGVTVIFITSTQNVGIGIASPTAQLHTTGTVRFANYGAGTATFDAGGNITSVSDEKYKTNIRRVPASGTTNINKVKALSPACYHFSTSSGLDTQNEYCGFLAGEVKKVIPEAVKTKQDVKYEQKLKTKGKTTEEDEYETIEVPTGTTTDSLDDRAIIITLVNAVKEQQAQIEQLQAEVAKLEGKKQDKL